MAWYDSFYKNPRPPVPLKFIKVLLTFIFGFLLVFTLSTETAYSQFTCTEWVCDDYCPEPDNCTGETCDCIAGDDGSFTCGAGYYVCNNGCCEILGGSGQRCDSCGPFPYGMQLTSITKTATSATVNWTGDFGGGIVACHNQGAYYFMVYVGTDYDAVNGNCGGITHGGCDVPANNWDYQGEGSLLPYGCTAVRQIEDDSIRSFNTADYGITLSPGTTYYVKVNYNVGKDFCSDEPLDDQCMGLGPIATLNACSITPSSADLAVGGAPVSFTTDAYDPNSVPVFQTSVTGVNYYPYHCAKTHCDRGDCGCVEEYFPRYVITGNFGQTANKPQVQITYNNQVIYRALGIGGNEMTIQASDLHPTPPAGSLTTANVNVWYPTPAYPTYGSSLVLQCGKNCGSEDGCQPCMNGSTTCAGGCSQVVQVDGIKVHGYHFGPGGKIRLNVYDINNLSSPLLSKVYDVPENEEVLIPHSDLINAGFTFNGMYANYPGANYSPAYYIEPSYTAESTVGDLSVIPNVIAEVRYQEWPTPGFISINPSLSTDKENNWPTLVSAIQSSDSPTNLRASVYAEGVSSIPATQCISQILTAGEGDTQPWWQVKDSDIQANGDLLSTVPDAEFFGLDGGGGYPGVVAYSGQTNITSANVSSTGWLANSGAAILRSYDYDSFYNLIPADVTFTDVDSGNVVSEITSSGTEQYGYYWYKYDGSTQGDLNLTSALDIGSKKVILLVDNANFNIASNINLTDNQGFFMVIVNGNITVDPTVGGSGGADLEGIYVADGIFNTGTAATQLWTRGSVVAYGGINMGGRDLGNPANASTPSVLFEYAPDQILLFPSKLGVRKINWKEVAP